MVQISTSFGGNGGDGISALSKIIEQRMKYLGETARDSIAATAINVLSSLRTITKVAKPSKVKVEVKRDSSLFPSAYTEGGDKNWRKNNWGKRGIRKLCLRYKGSRERYYGTEKIKYPNEKLPLNTLSVYRYTYERNGKKTEYLIVAQGASQAKKIAKRIAGNKLLVFAGLAKRALGVLMFKTNTKRVNDGMLSPKVEKKADMTTRKYELALPKSDGGGGTYTLALEDNLKYALDALKGGQSQVSIQMKKASNKVISIINQKLKNNSFFTNQKLPTPFPEVR